MHVYIYIWINKFNHVLTLLAAIGFGCNTYVAWRCCHHEDLSFCMLSQCCDSKEVLSLRKKRGLSLRAIRSLLLRIKFVIIFRHICFVKKSFGFSTAYNNFYHISQILLCQWISLCIVYLTMTKAVVKSLSSLIFIVRFFSGISQWIGS